VSGRLLVPVVVPLGAALLLPACARFRSWTWPVLGRTITGIALISYSLYLCNLTVIQVVRKVAEFITLPFWLQVAGYAAGTLIVGMVSYRWIERPFILLYKRRTQAPPGRNAFGSASPSPDRHDP
ncbi:MAG: acyltransferase family protein, partial [Rhodanobacter sp.]